MDAQLEGVKRSSPLSPKKGEGTSSRNSDQRLFQADGFNRANVDARAAIAAGIRIDDGYAVLHRNRVQGAGINTGLTSGALLGVYFCCH
jgi:hypothetical protein